jgi:hypothetical protein
MKFLLFFFALSLSLVTFAIELPDAAYTVDSIVYRSSLADQEAAFHIKFNHLPTNEFRGGKMIPNAQHTITYSYTGLRVNQTVVLDQNQAFELKLKPGKYSFQFYYNDTYHEISTFEIEAKAKHKTFVSCYMERAQYRITAEKPVIYLYPSVPTLVDVKVNPVGEFSFTYPIYENGWKVTAHPDGQLTHNKQSFNYLFWESTQDWKPATKELESGFVVKKAEVISFLEEKLTAFGFNSKEKADFITFWGPQLIQNERNFVHFMFNEECNEFAELEISPKPDHMYRFYMISMPLIDGSEYMVSEQEIKSIDRSGFTVLEWGGTKITKEFLQIEDEL